MRREKVMFDVIKKLLCILLIAVTSQAVAMEFMAKLINGFKNEKAEKNAGAKRVQFTECLLNLDEIFSKKLNGKIYEIKLNFNGTCLLIRYNDGVELVNAKTGIIMGKGFIHIFLYHCFFSDKGKFFFYYGLCEQRMIDTETGKMVEGLNIDDIYYGDHYKYPIDKFFHSKSRWTTIMYKDDQLKFATERNPNKNEFDIMHLRFKDAELIDVKTGKPVTDFNGSLQLNENFIALEDEDKKILRVFKKPSEEVCRFKKTLLEKMKCKKFCDLLIEYEN